MQRELNCGYRNKSQRKKTPVLSSFQSGGGNTMRWQWRVRESRAKPVSVAVAESIHRQDLTQRTAQQLGSRVQQRKRGATAGVKQWRGLSLAETGGRMQ